MACIQSVEKYSRVRAAYLTHNDAVRPVAKSGLEQIRETDLALVCIELGVGADDVGFFNIRFRDIFIDQDSIAVRDQRRQHIGESRLAGAGSTGDQ